MAERRAANEASWKATFFTALAAIICVALAAYLLDRAAIDRARDHATLSTLDQLGKIRAALEGAVWRDTALVRGLVVEIGTTPDINGEEFAAFVDGLLSERTAIIHIAAAQNMVITHVHPLEGNEAALGLDYRTVPDQEAAVRLAMDTLGTVVAGPVELVQGGKRLIIRSPVLYQVGDPPMDRIWGIVAAVVDYEVVLEQAELLGGDMPIQVGLRGTNGLGADGEPFFGPADIHDADPVVTDIELPHGSWQAAALPAAGWPTSSVASPIIWTVAILLSAFIAIVAAQRLRLDAQRSGSLRLLAESETRFRSVFDNANDGILIIGAKCGIIRDANRRAADLFGLALESLLGRPGGQLIGSERFLQSVDGDKSNRLIDEGGIFRSRIIKADGRERPVEISATPFEIEGEQVVLAHIRDLTERIERERALSQALRDAEHANMLKTRFLANVSHEIRTPLNAIVGFSDMMCRQVFGPLQPPRYQEYATDIHNSGRHLLTVINDILDLSRIEANEVSLDPEWISLSAAVQESLRMADPLADQFGVKLGTWSVPDGIEIYADHGRLCQMLINLLTNALKFTNAGGDVRVVCQQRDDGALALAVSDTGVGMTADQIAETARPFGRRATSRIPGRSGTGLGIPITRAFAKAQDIDMAIDSQPDVGTTVSLTIPSDRLRTRMSKQEPAGTSVGSKRH